MPAAERMLLSKSPGDVCTQPDMGGGAAHSFKRPPSHQADEVGDSLRLHDTLRFECDHRAGRARCI